MSTKVAMTDETGLAEVRRELLTLVEEREAIKRQSRAADERALRIRAFMEQQGLVELLGEGVKALLYDTTSTRSDVEVAKRILTKEQFDAIFRSAPSRAFRASRSA